MKRLNLILLVSIVLVLTSCQTEMDDNESNVKALTSSQIYCNKIPVNEALDCLDNFISDVYDVGTRYGGRRIASVEVLGGSQVASITRTDNASIPDSLLYLVNFDNNQGFAIMAADRRMGSALYAVTEQGSLTQDDINTILTTGSVMEDGSVDGSLFAKELALEGALADFNEDEMTTQAANKTVISVERFVDTVRRTKTPVLVKTKWHQGYPFNRMLEERNQVGCVPIAVAQILLAERRVPQTQSYWSVMCNLDTLETVYHYSNVRQTYFTYDQNAEVTKLPTLPSIYSTRFGTYEARVQCGGYAGKIASLCGIGKTASSHSATVYDAKRAFKNWSVYDNVSVIIGYASDAHKQYVLNMLLDQRPVFMCGGTVGEVSGHAWVLDGYVQEIRQDVTRTTYNDFTEDIEIDETILHHYVHVNWGWAGMSDGYYKSDLFDIRERIFCHQYDNGSFRDDNNDDMPDDEYYDGFFYMIQY